MENQQGYRDKDTSLKLHYSTLIYSASLLYVLPVDISTRDMNKKDLYIEHWMNTW